MNSRRRNILSVAAPLMIVVISRAVGFARELIISVGFGFSAATDAFYQLCAVPTYLNTYIGGPFSTAYIAWSTSQDAPAESAQLPVIARQFLLTAMVITVAFFIGAMGLTLHRGGGWVGMGASILMAPACLATAIIAFAAAVSNARGKFGLAQGIVFLNNATFVGLISILVFIPFAPVTLLLTSAYCIAALVTLLVALHSLRNGARHGPFVQNGAAMAPDVRHSVRRRLVPMLLYASLETGGFLLTQMIVLVLASLSGAGVTSAISMAQRLCLTANGLIIGPMSNIAMVRLARKPDSEKRSFLLKAAFATIGGLSIVALMLVAGRSYLPVLLGGRGHFSADNARLLSSLIPGYAMWLVAQGANMMLGRLSFTQGRARMFTVTTTIGYVIANLARLVTWKLVGFPVAVLAGATVELGAALCIIALIVSRPPAMVDAKETAL